MLQINLFYKNGKKWKIWVGGERPLTSEKFWS